ncbi:hypothetical protein [Streptomyces phaeoluteigriseus]|uniref:hypothetical protein n=1 Tax=Streptomyces phaeoluteigriseus TaxID=114686 RepID=UPI001301B1DC|nr:hypothetical protein [Streptomyces phaeoluteigriseus]
MKRLEGTVVLPFGTAHVRTGPPLRFAAEGALVGGGDAYRIKLPYRIRWPAADLLHE